MDRIPFELFFVLFFILASVLDAMGRSRKKRERMDEMEREEAESTDDSAVGTRAESAGAGRETADSMVPPDLWAILTGQLPPEKEGEGKPAPKRRPPPETMSPKEAQERADVRVPPERSVRTEAPSRSEPGPFSAPGEWGRGTAKLPEPARRGKMGRDVPEPRAGRAPQLPERARWKRESAPLTPAPAIRGEIGALGLPEEGGSVFARPSMRAAPLRSAAPLQRVGAGPSPYTALLRASHPEALREAIVLTEILGPPVSVRPPNRSPWEER